MEDAHARLQFTTLLSYVPEDFGLVFFITRAFMRHLRRQK